MQGIDIDQAAFVKFKREWYLDQISLVRPVMPVLAIAHEAQRRGIPMAIASGGGREHVLGAISANGLQSMFGAFICAEVCWHAQSLTFYCCPVKPESRPIQRCSSAP
jgi:FMN phosphatase YigB (HAD superfamily)